MIKALLILFCIFSTTAQSAMYYVDCRAGDDAADGSVDRPWRTLGMSASKLRSSDVCVIREGIYRETVLPAADGVTFRAADGARVVVTGCDEVRGWQRETGGVFRASVDAEVRDLFVAGKQMNPARFPDEDGDRLSVDEWAATQAGEVSRDAGGSIVVQFKGQTWPDGYWDGAYYCGLHGHNHYQPNFGKVTATKQHGLTLGALSGAVLANPPEFTGDGRGYLIRHRQALDSPREWHWEKGTLLFMPPKKGEPQEVQARVRLWGFDLSGRRGVTIEGINFFACSVLMEGSHECEVTRGNFRYHSPWGAFREPFQMQGERGWYAYGSKEDATAGVFIRGEANRVSHCNFREFWGQGVHLREGRGNVVEYCTFENFNWLLLQDGAAVFVNGHDHEVRHCRIRNTAAMGISGKQVGPNCVRGVKVLHCDIADTGRVLLDGGQSAIYFNNHNLPTEQRHLDGEIAWNVIGTVHGIADNGKGMGIYLDDGTDFTEVHHNLVEAGPKVRWPIFMHVAGHVFESSHIHHNAVWGFPDDPRSAAIVAIPRPKVGSIQDVLIEYNLSQREVFKTLHGSPDGVTLRNNTPDATHKQWDAAKKIWSKESRAKK
jgi:hypothetical protein